MSCANSFRNYSGGGEHVMKVEVAWLRVNRVVTAAALGLLFLAPVLVAEDWPRWRGPRGDGSWHGPKLPEKWPAAGLKRIWSQPIGGGYAGPAVVDGRLFILDRHPAVGHRPAADGQKKDEPTGRRADSRLGEGPTADWATGRERILCLDAATGKRLWLHEYATAYGDLGGYSNGPRAMPTVYQGRVYTLGAVGHVHCLDAASGKVIWSKDMVREHKARVPMWGFAASPVIDEDRVIIHAGAEPNGCLMAFNRITGEEVWRSLPDPAGYATPILIASPSGKQLVAWTPENIHGLDPRTGKRLWSVEYRVTYGVSIATPIYREGIVFVSGYWEGSKAIRLGPKPGDAEVVWEENARLNGLMAQPLYRDGRAYLIEKSQGLVCFDLKTGKKLWDDHRLTPRGRNPHATIVWLGDRLGLGELGELGDLGDRGDGRVLILNSVAELILARLSPKGYEEQSRTKVLDGKVWGHPAFAGTNIYARTDGAEQAKTACPFELVCVSLIESK